MWRRCLIIGMVFAFGLILLTPSTWAFDEESVPCEQADLEGTWNARMGAIDKLMKHTGWDTFKLTIGATGSIKPGGTYNDCMKVESSKSEIIGGRLSLSRDCVIEGYIETSSGTLYIGFGQIAEDELVLAREEVFRAAEISPSEPYLRTIGGTRD